VPTQQLVKLVSRIADRQFASILQFFLHEYARFTLGHMELVARSKKGAAAHIRPLVDECTAGIEVSCFLGPK
jgi:hypothetical protein